MRRGALLVALTVLAGSAIGASELDVWSWGINNVYEGDEAITWEGQVQLINEVTGTTIATGPGQLTGPFAWGAGERTCTRYQTYEEFQQFSFSATLAGPRGVPIAGTGAGTSEGSAEGPPGQPQTAGGITEFTFNGVEFVGTDLGALGFSVGDWPHQDLPADPTTGEPTGWRKEGHSAGASYGFWGTNGGTRMEASFGNGGVGGFYQVTFRECRASGINDLDPCQEQATHKGILQCLLGDDDPCDLLQIDEGNSGEINSCFLPGEPIQVPTICPDDDTIGGLELACKTLDDLEGQLQP